jgi:DNA polymerase I
MTSDVDNTKVGNSESPMLYLIDGSAYIYRAFHAVRGLVNSKGMPTNAVFGFTRMLIKLIQERRPQYMAMFFDAKGPTFRHAMYSQYKANRPPMPDELVSQLPWIKKVTDAFRLPIVEVPGYEADDLIGTCARLAESAGHAVVMVTGDKDFVQLVTDRTSIWDPMKDRIIDMATVGAEYNLAPAQIIDMMGLSGDTADNVPGVPGIGPKTALSLIQQFGSMDALYERIDELTRKKQRENLTSHKEQAFLSRRLVTIDTHAPVEFDPDVFKSVPPDEAALGRLFQELEFRQLQQEFQQSKPEKPVAYEPILTTAALDALVDRLQNCPRFAVDTETTSQNPMEAVLVGISIAMEPGEAFYIPVGHRYVGAPEQLPRKDVLDRLRPVFQNQGVSKIGQNIKYDWTVFRRHGVDLQGVGFDTMLASYLLNPSKRAHNLD